MRRKAVKLSKKLDCEGKIGAEENPDSRASNLLLNRRNLSKCGACRKVIREDKLKIQRKEGEGEKERGETVQRKASAVMVGV